MHHRRSTATALVAVLLPLAAALTSCADEPRTNMVNTIGAGTNNRDADVDVLGARVLAYPDGQARLIGTLVYKDLDGNQPDGEPATLEEVAGEGLTVGSGGSLGIEIEPDGLVNLASEDAEPIPVEGDFAAGDVLELTYSFSTQEVVELEVPVVKPCGQYADIVAPGSEAGDAAEEAGEVDAESADESAEESAEESTDEETDATYVCDHPTESVENEEAAE